MNDMLFQRLALTAALLTLCVVVLGAYVRLSHAGLGCPDWPGCYGHLGVPNEAHLITQANAAYPQRPLEVDKAWKEMIHRYFAGILGLMVFALAWLAWRRRRESGQPLVLPLLLAVLIIFQALLGMWTVTLLLKPLVVTAHLLGGLTTLALLWWLVLRQGRLKPVPQEQGRSLRPWALLGLALVVGQVALGGWTSANYAALACPDFPTCQGQWWPAMDPGEAFVPWRGLGMSYEGGVLDNEARVAVHMAHRLGAVLVLAYLGWLLWWILSQRRPPVLRGTGQVVALLLVAQLGLGIANVVLHLPLPLAAAHNAGAALLILSLVTLNHLLYPRETR